MTVEGTQSTALRERFAEITGADHVHIKEDVIDVHPGSSEEIAAVLAFATRSDLKVDLRGGGTKYSWGGPVRADVVLQTTRLNRVLEHAWQDMTCTVQAGCSWSKLQAMLVQHGQFVALDPLWPDTATIGGIVSTNDSGSLRHKYGSLRDLVIGSKIVLADGTIAISGGKVVKNVAGYDLPKLMTGAFGTLGVLTEITFRLHSRPVQVSTHTIRSFNRQQIQSFLLRLLDSHLSLNALQLRSSGSEFLLDLQLAGVDEVLRDQQARLKIESESIHLICETGDVNVWLTREQMFSKDGFLLKATMLPSQIADYAAAIDSMNGSSVTQAVGIMTAAVPSSSSTQLLEWRREVEKNGGSVTILRQVEDAALDRWGTLPATLRLMREIKRQFDPTSTLNPGRFLGGI